MNSFSYLEPVCCSMSSSNCCFLTCIQISQEAHQVVWYSHLFQNFPQFLVIHTVKGFSIVNKAEIDVLLELSCFFYTHRYAIYTSAKHTHMPYIDIYIYIYAYRYIPICFNMSLKISVLLLVFVLDNLLMDLIGVLKFLIITVLL